MRRKRCKSCNELFEPKFSTVQMVCSTKCAIEYSNKKKAEQAERMETLRKEHKTRNKLPRELELTQKVFNEYIRLRDIGKPCISSLIPWKKDFDAGHAFSVKQYSELRFDEDNVHAQSIQENRFNEGNFESYLLNLKNRIGETRFKGLLEKAELSKQRVFKWSLEELKSIRIKYKNKIKELKQG